ncbi:MAG: FtsX-like permease family protein [Burkholderiaceae bacterium]
MFFVFKLLTRNAMRQKLRIGLTMVGLVVAICAFGLLRTIVDAWYAGVEGTSSIRLVTRNSISLVFPLPLNYAQRMRQVDGVNGVSWGNWFGGVYITERNFFPQFAIDGQSYFDMYPEYVVKPAEMKAFLADRQGAVVGHKLADQYGWKLGDQVPLRGTIYPGTWTFTVRAIYDGVDAKTDESQFLFHWAYLNETTKKKYGRKGDQVGFYIERLANPDDAAEVSKQIDNLFRNSLAETLTETEKAFQLGFISMTELILVAIQAVSFVVILIIMAVMANTIAMTARERTSEYATLKALGFSPGFIGWLIVGESMFIALVGGAIAVAVTFPIAAAFGKTMGTLFPIFFVSKETVLFQFVAAAVIGLVSAAWPAWSAGRIRIVDGLRHVA